MIQRKDTNDYHHVLGSYFALYRVTIKDNAVTDLLVALFWCELTLRIDLNMIDFNGRKYNKALFWCELLFRIDLEYD